MQPNNRWIHLTAWYFLLSVLLASCSLQPLALPPLIVSPTGQGPSVEYAGKGVAYGIQEAEGEKFWRVYQTPSGLSFRGRFRLLNQLPAQDYLLTCMLDYRQVPCVFGDQQDILHRISLAESEDRYTSFTIPILTPGFHDFALLAIANPDVHDLDPGYRLNTDFNYLYAARLVLLAGNQPWPTPAIEYAITGTKPVRTTPPLNGLVVNREPPAGAWERAWLTQDAKPEETIEYYVRMGNDSGPSRSYAVFAFLDYTQIPLDGDDQWVAFVALPAGTRASLPARLVAPSEPGVHELMVVWAYDPYQMLEEPFEGSSRHLTEFLDYMESSIRVAITVSRP